MKLLRNPVVVSLLAVLAVAVVLHALWPQLTGFLSSGREPDAPVARAVIPAAPNQATALPTPAPAAQPAGVALDQPLERTDLPRWSGSPTRDPFRSAHVSNPDGSMTIVPAAKKLALSSILRQTGGSVAVINLQIVGEGDTIEGFLIQKIETDRVWVTGANGLEAVGFKSDLAARTNDRPDVPGGANSHADP